jgi:hypothetical protein
LVSLAKNPSLALIQDAEIGEKVEVQCGWLANVVPLAAGYDVTPSRAPRHRFRSGCCAKTRTTAKTVEIGDTSGAIQR